MSSQFSQTQISQAFQYRNIEHLIKNCNDQKQINKTINEELIVGKNYRVLNCGSEHFTVKYPRFVKYVETQLNTKNFQQYFIGLDEKLETDKPFIYKQDLCDDFLNSCLFTPQMFDVIVSEYCFPQNPAFLKNVKKLLKPNGIYITPKLNIFSNEANCPFVEKINKEKLKKIDILNKMKFKLIKSEKIKIKFIDDENGKITKSIIYEHISIFLNE